MTIKLLLIGKTKDKNIQKLIDQYSKRLSHYCNFKMDVVPEPKTRKTMAENAQKENGGEALLKKIQASDHVILLDEKGKEFSSVGFSKWLQKQMNSGKKQVVFIVGGPYGFSDKIYQRADGKMALSQMTFTHEMVRLIFVEQLYRGFTILRNEPYHHR